MTKSTAQRVAEACGWETNGDRFGGRRGVWLKLQPDDTGNEDFDPEHVERDAVLAAEKFGLFDHEKRAMVLTQDYGLWIVREDHCAIISEHKSFCEAICSAILKLSEAANAR